jgi:PAP2 superfamily
VLALWPLVRRKWLRALLALYPFTIFFCIVVTANHWVLDAAGGLVVLGIGYSLSVGLERLLARIRGGTPRAAGAGTAPPR